MVSALLRPRVDVHQPVRLPDRQGFEQRRIHHSEDRDVHAESKSKCEGRCDREDRGLAKGAKGVSKVLQQRVHVVSSAVSDLQPTRSNDVPGNRPVA